MQRAAPMAGPSIVSNGAPPAGPRCGSAASSRSPITRSRSPGRCGSTPPTPACSSPGSRAVPWQAGRRSVALSLIGGRIDGVAGLAGKLMPQAVEPLRKYESRLGPLNIKARLDVEPGNGAATSVAKLKLTGRIAGIDTTLDANASG